jgi:hypothetical protein
MKRVFTRVLNLSKKKSGSANLVMALNNQLKARQKLKRQNDSIGRPVEFEWNLPAGDNNLAETIVVFE